jgi:hypothetical protein
VAAERPPHVTGVVVDGQPSLGLSSVESGKDGIRTVAVSFDEPVLFTAAQVAVDVVNVVGSAMSIRQITPASVTGSGSSTMLIAFAAGDVYQNTIEITLSGDPAGGVTDLAGNVLDGEAAGGGAYLADGSRDLPSGNGAPGGAASFYETAFTDLVAPRVTSVMIDNTPALNVSGVERSAQGISTITVLFSKPVTFDSSSVVIQPADSIGGAPLPGVSPLTPLRITGSGTNTMTITLAPGSVLQTVLRLTLDGDLADVNSIRDLSPTGNVLDGEPKVAADTYLANASTDLPSGDGTAGGSASFYVAAERPPHVTAVVVDGQPGLGLSSTEVGKDGLGTIAVSFDEPVVFSAGQVQVDVVNAVGSTTSLRQVTPTSVTGNGTDTMLISLAAGDVRQATIRVMLSGNISGGITDLAGNVLDGDGRAGDLYLAGPVDLPSGDGTPGGSASFYVTAFTDLVAPRVVSVVLDGNANWGLSATDHHLDGINTITIVFSKPVTFSDGAVVIQPVDSIGGAPLEGSTPVPPQSITGSGTNTMTITFAAGTAANGFWRVSLDGSVGESQAITDLSPTGNVLDGEPKVAADAYLAGAADLPSGDGTAGGSAVFYVAAAPMAGDFNGDGVVNGKDFLIWQEHYPQLGGAGQADGDANGDGNVNGADFLIWQGHYDPTPPTVTAVTVNNTPAEGVSSTDSSDGGIQTVTVTFSEPVTFTAQDVQVQVTDRVGGTTRTALAAPPAISGSGTDTMTLTFAPGSVVNKVLCITLAGTAASDGSAIADLAGNLLDGQAKGGGAYLASAADLPSGDGTAGGSAVFYVVSRTSSGLPGDFNGDGFVNGADFLIWQQNYGKIGGATLAMGDANGDGNVTGADFLVWQENYQPMK